MSDNSYSPNLFLFQSYVTEVLKEGKKYIKTAPFDAIDPDTLLLAQKNQYIDIYHQYFLASMSHLKTRQIACSNYDKLIKQGLLDKDHLPVSLISSVLTACSNIGGSTSGSSSLGSASLSTNPLSQNIYIGSLIKSILLGTYQPMGQLLVGLNYLLEGTRKKQPATYNSMLDEVYSILLIKLREAPIDRLVNRYVNNLLDEVQAHFEEQKYVFASRKINQSTNKIQMPIFQEGKGFGKFGKCFICSKQAYHYMKQEYIPICSIGCRDKVKDLFQQCKKTEHFNLMAWLLDNLTYGDQIIYSFLLKELHFCIGKNCLPLSQLQTVLKIIVHQLNNNSLSRHMLPCISVIITRWYKLILPQEVSPETAERLQKYFKVYYLQIITILQESPINKQMLNYVSFFADVVSNQDIFLSIFTRYDSRFFQINILAKILNILSQYAKKFPAGTEGLQNIVKMLMKKYIERGDREDNWELHGQYQKKRQLKKVIALFNKKPTHGIKMLKKLFQITDKEHIEQKIIQSNSEFTDSQIQIASKDDDSYMSSPEKKLQIQQEREGTQQKEEFEQLQQMQIEADDQQKQKQENLGANQDNNENNQEQIEIDQLPQNNMTEIPFDPQKIINDKINQIIRESQNKSQQIKQTQIIIQNQQHQQNKKQPNNQKKVEIEKKKENKILTRLTSKDIAIFIRQNLQGKNWTPSDQKLPIPIYSLQKIKVGQYFGSDDEEVRQICQAFLHSFSFDDVEVDDVMRIVLNSFSLPKQTQQIDRVMGDISLRLLGRYNLADDTAIFQYIYLLLMVQTTNQNPNVRQKQKMTLQTFLSMSQFIQGGVSKERAIADYQRITQCPLDIKMKYPEEAIFIKKYLNNLSQMSQRLFNEQQLQTGCMSRDIMLFVWEYLVIGLIWPGNTKGLWESVILLGREGLAEEQKGFFQALRKQGGGQASSDINGLLLRLGIQYGNDLHGRLWDCVIHLIYSLQNQNQFNSAVLDKLFTNSGQLSPPRLRDFIQSLLMFSTSEFKKDTLYNRQLFVLRHINSLLEYNIPRFPILANHIWNLLDKYFKDICLHPRREIAMAAIDSYKQLTLKLFKLRQEAVPHEAIMQTYCHIFQRSCLQMKDLIANVLLNLITIDMRGGWQWVYSILDILDTKDKHLVVRIISRCITEVGMQRLANLPRLHSICIKELRVCNDSVAIEQLLNRLWDLSQFINDPQIWLQTMRSIKDIFKITLNNELLLVFIKMNNRCLRGIRLSEPPNGGVQQEPTIQQEVKGQQKQLDKQIFAQIVDLLMFLIQLKLGNSNKKVIQVLLCSLETIQQLQVDFIIKYLGGSYGFMSIFQMYLSSQNKLPFAIFLKNYLINILLPAFEAGKNLLQLQQLCLWCVNQYYDNLPLELINLRDKDKDFEKDLNGLLKDIDIQAERGKDIQNQNTLIEFHLSHKQYQQKSTLHLIFLQVIEDIYKQMQRHQSSAPQAKPIVDRIKGKIVESVLDSYDYAVKINKLILLRNFLWNNGFLSGKSLPGLHKQEHRTLKLIIKLFPFPKSYPLVVKHIQHYIAMTHHLHRLKQIEQKIDQTLTKSAAAAAIKTNKKHEEKHQVSDVRNFSIYSIDTELWLQEAKKGLSIGLAQLRWELSKAAEERWLKNNKQYMQLSELCVSLLDIRALSHVLCNEVCETLKSLSVLVL